MGRVRRRFDMKRTDRLTNWIAFLLFLAFAAYVAVYLVRSLQGATVTAEAAVAVIELSGTASGIVIREEVTLRSAEPYIDVTAAEGEKMAAGSVLATALRSERGLERITRMHELEREIGRVSAALQELRSAGDVTRREEALENASRALAAAVARHDAAALDSASLNLEALLLEADSDAVSAANLDALTRELDSLRGSADADAQVLRAAVPGVFSAAVDGYERYGYADIRDLTPSGLRTLIENRPEPEADAYGKLVTDHRWYFAAVMSAADAAQLTPGQDVLLNFSRRYGADIPTKTLSVSDAEDGTVVVVFRCDTALTGTLAMRSATAGVIFGEFSGIRVPAGAVRTDDETGGSYVWTVTAMQLERKDIEILYADEEYVIARRGADAGSLREGNTVVVSGNDLYEGKLIDE